VRRFVPTALVLLLVCLPGRPASAQSTDQIPRDQTARPFSSLFTGAARDLAQLRRAKPLLVLATGAELAIVAIAADRNVRRHVPTGEGLDDAMDAGSVVGNGAIQGGAALGTYVMGRLLHKPSVAGVGADLVEAQLVSGVLTQALKLTIARARPRGTARHSFPSGHTSATFATAAVLEQRFGWRVGIPAYAAAAYVGLSRISADEHYVSDVIFGAAVGIASARTIDIRHRARLKMTPYVARGSAAITFAVLPALR
jgi:membrane-associated phospholipid phosphatase